MRRGSLRGSREMAIDELAEERLVEVVRVPETQGDARGPATVGEACANHICRQGQGVTLFAALKRHDDLGTLGEPSAGTDEGPAAREVHGARQQDESVLRGVEFELHGHRCPRPVPSVTVRLSSARHAYIHAQRLPHPPVGGDRSRRCETALKMQRRARRALWIVVRNHKGMGEGPGSSLQMQSRARIACVWVT